MRRSICVCEPAFAYAGHCYNWKFVYTSSVKLPKGTMLKFDLLSEGRAVDWEVPQTNLKRLSNVIYARIGDSGKPITAKKLDTDDQSNQFEFVLPSEVKAGEEVTIFMGLSEQAGHSENTKGNCSQKYLQRRRPFYLYIDPKGTGKYTEPEVFTLDVRGNVLHSIRVITPSFVIKNKRFDVVLRFEDQFGNLTSHAPSDTLIDLTYEHLRENLKWQLFVPETGFIVLPNLYFNEIGIYKIRLNNLKNEDVFTSAPIKCFSDGNLNLYWGLLHGESDRHDSLEDIENCLRHMRDERALSFYAVSTFDSPEETPTESWKMISQQIADFNEDDRFVNFLGFQWHGENKEEGLRQVIYAKDGKPLLRYKDAKSNTLKKLYKHLTPKESLAIPVSTMGENTTFDFKAFDPEVERVVEIYNSWGASECTKAEGNNWAIKSKGKTGIKESKEGSLIAALRNNCRFGFTAGGLDDRGAYADLSSADQQKYSPGLTGVFAETLTRESLLEAMYNRSCYATTGERIILGFFLAGESIGSELSTAEKPGLVVNRHLSGYIAGMDTLDRVEVIRNGDIIATLNPPEEGYSFEFTYDDLEKLDSVILPKGFGEFPFVFYYIRAYQKNGQMAWSSPIWVDHPLASGKKMSRVVAKIGL